MTGKRLPWFLWLWFFGGMLLALAAAAIIARLNLGALGFGWLGEGWLVRLPLVLAALAAIAALGSWLVSRWVGQGLANVTEALERLTRGDPTRPGRVPNTAEFRSLAEALERMAQRHEERISSLERRANEQAAVLASMAEGVLAVDAEQRIISANAAAARLLGTHGRTITGRTLQEVVRNADLRRLVSRALVRDCPVDGDVVLRHANDRVLQVNGTSLRDAQGRSIGAVIVLNDVSRLRQLESMRRDFAANVSHELKTPITSIKGFVETLLDGALQDPHDAERFLRIVARQADRLNAIIEDLLSLSRVEKDAEAAEIALSMADLRPVLESALDDCKSKASLRGIRLAFECAAEVMARINPPLLEQAVMNLLDNAVKYSEPGGDVHLLVQAASGEVSIRVRDHGCGIAPEHLPRLFERFYRVDKARSRKQGGTGLGLAIVKHIVLAHRGRVTVESEPGAGSTFCIHLPAP